MNTDDKRIRNRLKRIRVRVDNWSQDKGYGPGERAKDTAERDVIFRLNHIADLQVEAREKNAWEGRYWALLEECEASRPRTVEGDGSDLPVGTVAIDNVGDAWRRHRLEGWASTGDGPHNSLPESRAPTPSSTPPRRSHET